MSDQLAYDYDHSKATVPELINKLRYLADKGALTNALSDPDFTQTQRKWKLIAGLEKHYALQREQLNINMKDYLRLCYEKTYRSKMTCPELRNILSQYDIVYPDEPSRVQLVELLEKNIMMLRVINHCREAEKARKKAEKLEKARKDAEKARKRAEDGRTLVKAVDEDIEDESSDEDEKEKRKEVKGTPGAWRGKMLNPHVVYPALGLVSSAAMWFLQ